MGGGAAQRPEVQRLLQTVVSQWESRQHLYLVGFTRIVCWSEVCFDSIESEDNCNTKLAHAEEISTIEIEIVEENK